MHKQVEQQIYVFLSPPLSLSLSVSLSHFLSNPLSLPSSLSKISFKKYVISLAGAAQ